MLYPKLREAENGTGGPKKYNNLNYGYRYIQRTTAGVDIVCISLD
jgi:hypothetical protein